MRHYGLIEGKLENRWKGYEAKTNSKRAGRWRE